MPVENMFIIIDNERRGAETPCWDILMTAHLLLFLVFFFLLLLLFLQTKPLTVITAVLIWMLAIFCAAPAAIVSDVNHHILDNTTNLTIYTCSPFGSGQNHKIYAQWVLEQLTNKRHFSHLNFKQLWSYGSNASNFPDMNIRNSEKKKMVFQSVKEKFLKAFILNS